MAAGAAVTVTKKPVQRMAAGKVWLDSTLEDWPDNDFRIFVGNLSPDISDQELHNHFSKKYASLARSKVVLDQKGVPKGYGFCSFLQPLDCAKAIREMDQTWLGTRPIRVKRSDWKDRNLSQVRKQTKKQAKQQRKRGGGF
jgi:RNA recognition motif-containing protein